MTVSLDEFASLLDSRSRQDVQNANDFLAACGTEALSVLHRLLHEGSDRQTINAAVMLGQVGDEGCIDALITVLHTHPNPVVRSSTAKILATFGDERIPAALSMALYDEDTIVSAQAVLSMGKFGGPFVFSTLMTMLETTQSSILRYSIIRTLGDLGDTAAAALIATFLHDADTHVRHDAALALEKLGREIPRSLRGGNQG